MRLFLDSSVLLAASGSLGVLKPGSFLEQERAAGRLK